MNEKNCCKTTKQMLNVPNARNNKKTHTQPTYTQAGNMTNGEQGIKCYTAKSKQTEREREKKQYNAFAWTFRCETSA